jgi:ribosomal protein S1
LAIGYIVNIGKSGCFVQIGHNTVIRAGLNELSDDANFNFNHEMPIGSIVFGRVYRIDTQPNGEKKFHFSTRQSIVVYGALAVERKSLQVGQQVESIVMAVADGKVFSQIKGSYVKIKVKGCNQSDNLSVGDHVFSTL